MRILGALLWILAAVLFALLSPPERTGIQASSGPSSPQLWSVPVRAEPDAGNLLPIARRPLFEPQRRPPVPVPARNPTPEPPRVQLSAVTVSSDVRIAVIRELDSGETRRVREGEKLNEWTLKRVRRDQIVLQWQDKQTIIPLFSGE